MLSGNNIFYGRVLSFILHYVYVCVHNFLKKKPLFNLLFTFIYKWKINFMMIAIRQKLFIDIFIWKKKKKKKWSTRDFIKEKRSFSGELNTGASLSMHHYHHKNHEWNFRLVYYYLSVCFHDQLAVKTLFTHIHMSRRYVQNIRTAKIYMR